MSATKMQIFNAALRYIGEGRVESADEDSDNANILRDIYDQKRRALLRELPWNFAVKSVELAQTTNTPVDYDYEYQLPADSLYYIGVQADRPDLITYEIRQDKLVTDESTFCLKYIYDITDTAQFDSLFVEALSFLLASAIAIPRTGDPAILNAMANGYQQAVVKARGMNMSESRTELRRPQSFIDVRS